MFTSVHKNRTTLILACALFLVSALPMVVRSQEDKKTTPKTATSTIQAQQNVASTQATNPYEIENLPGGGAIGDFVVGPGKVDVTIKPGESKVVMMNVSNRTGQRRIFNLAVEDTTASDDPTVGIQLLGNEHGPYSLKDYISFPSASFELDNNQRARVPVTITIPKDADAGGRYGTVLATTLAPKATTTEDENSIPQSAVVARIGTLFFVTIPGDISKDGALSKFGAVPEQHFFQSGPIKMGVLFENKGPIHLAPYGEIRIKNMLGDEVGYVQLDPWFVMPKSLRLREVTWNREFLFGRYTATVQLNRSYDDKIDTMTFQFWVLPWKLVLAAFAAVFILVFLIRAMFKNFEFRRKR